MARSNQPSSKHTSRIRRKPNPPIHAKDEDESEDEDMVEASRTSINSTTRDGSPSLTRETLELLRTRELYKYYEPLTTPGHPDDEEYKRTAVRESSDEDDSLQRPLSTSDPVLGSLVLLAERLLQADRVIVMFVDYFREYLIADSNAAIEYYTGEIQPEVSNPPKISRKRSLARKDLFSLFVGRLDKKDKLAVIDVRSEELSERYRWANVTRYAGMPLKSKTGTVIGMLCALYDEPRPKDLDLPAYTMKFHKLSKAVMRHMEVVRGEREKKKSRKMEIALSRFIAGNFSPDKVELTKPSDANVKVETASQELERMEEKRVEVSKERSEKELERWKSRDARRQENAKIDVQMSPPISQPSPGDTALKPTALKPTTPTDEPSYFDFQRQVGRSPPPDKSSSFAGKYGLPFKAPDRSPPIMPCSIEVNSDDSSPAEAFDASFLTTKPLFSPVDEKPKSVPEEPTPTPSKRPSIAGSDSGSLKNSPINLAEAHRALFMRASELMYQAMDVDGVAFINADLEGLADFVLDGSPDVQQRPGPHGGGGKTAAGHVSSDTQSSKKVREGRTVQMRERSGVLGFYDGHPVESRGPQISKLTEDDVTMLTESWPRGCVFAYSKDPTRPVVGFSVNRAGATSDSELDHAMEENPEVVDILRRFLPRSQSVVFLPLYDFVGKVFAVGFAWTSSSVRIFRGNVEGDFMAAFCDSIMSEVSRLQVVSANVAKANFISTMSHELRSPLHGILVSCSLFMETQGDEHQRDLIGTIRGCGKTLLDTVNNVLTFTKLNTKANQRAKGEQPQTERIEKDIDIAKLVEEVTDASYKGFQFTQGAEIENEQDMGLNNKEHVYMMLDVDPRISQYRFDLPPGAYRRLVLNLCTNSLKYTDGGWIKVGLDLVDSDEQEGYKRLMLTVADSGRGMSREFVKNNLFTPFSQENPMHSGTGLGMSIVRQLVEELGGTVNVRTTVAVGTEVTISAAFKAQPLGTNRPCWIAGGIQKLPGKRVSIVGFSSKDKPGFFGTGDALEGLHAFLKKTLTQTFGMQLTDLDKPLEEVTNESVDCIVSLGGRMQLDGLMSGIAAKKRPAVVELGGSLIGATASKRAMERINRFNGALVTISRPYCPRKIASALLFALGISQKKPLDCPSRTSTPAPIRITPPPPPVPADSASTKPSVLIVEDNPLNRKLLLAIVNKAGHPSEYAVDGLDALQRVERRPKGFDIIIMDLQMPVMTGIEATRAIRQLEKERQVQKPCYIITLTALSADTAKIESARAGSSLFITKPLQPRYLRDVLLKVEQERGYEVD